MKSNQYTIAKLKEEVSSMQLSELADFLVERQEVVR